MKNYIISEDGTLLETLAKAFPDSSKTTLRSWLKEGRIALDGHIAKDGSQQVKKNQKIDLEKKIRALSEGIQLIYEDQDLVIVDKPTGLLSVAAAFDKEKTVHSILKMHYKPKKVYVVHRLDQETSGVMVFALNEKTSLKLKEIFEKHDIERSYTALVEGFVQPSRGTWQSYQWEDPNYVVHSTPDPHKGRLAITHYLVKATSKKYSQLTLTLETGRKNQIRVHCQDAGYPVVGDKKYGSSKNPLKRLGLHAHLLAFHHPATGKKMRFESPVPPVFDRLIRELEEIDAH